MKHNLKKFDNIVVLFNDRNNSIVNYFFCSSVIYIAILFVIFLKYLIKII